VVQVFTPRRVESVEADTAWTPLKKDIAYAVSADCTVKISGGTATALLQGTIRGIVEGATYTFSATQTIEVM